MSLCRERLRVATRQISRTPTRKCSRTGGEGATASMTLETASGRAAAEPNSIASANGPADWGVNWKSVVTCFCTAHWHKACEHAWSESGPRCESRGPSPTGASEHASPCPELADWAQPSPPVATTWSQQPSTLWASTTAQIRCVSRSRIGVGVINVVHEERRILPGPTIRVYTNSTSVGRDGQTPAHSAAKSTAHFAVGAAKRQDWTSRRPVHSSPVKQSRPGWQTRGLAWPRRGRGSIVSCTSRAACR